MDIEFVVDYSDQTAPKIYIVQVRPIVPPKISVQPSYLYDPSCLNNIHQCTTIGAAGGALREITDAEEIIIASTAIEGLNTYLASSNKQKIKAVITGKIAATTSHEATTLRSQGIPLVFVDNLTTIKTVQPTTANPLVIDLQRAIFGTVQHSYKVIDGWFTHPLPMQASLSASAIDEQAIEQYLQGYSDTKKHDLKNLVEQLKDFTSRDLVQAQAILKTIVDNAFQLYKDSRLSNEQRDEITAILHAIFTSAQNIEQTLSKATEKRSLDVLYAIKFLEAALFQPRKKEIVNSYSLQDFTQNFEHSLQNKQALAGLEYDAQKTPYLERLMDGQFAALTDVQETAWTNFVRDLHTQASAKEIQEFEANLAQLTELGALELFINTEFINYQGSAREKLQQFNADYAASEQLLKNLNDQKNRIEAFDLSLWEDPNRFEQQWNKLQNILTYFMGTQIDNDEEVSFEVLRDKNFYEYKKYNGGDGLHFHHYTTPQFKAEFEQATSVGKKTALATMHNLVNLCDLSMKAITGSRDYPIEKKITYATTMTQTIYYLLKQWANFENTLNAPRSCERFCNGGTMFKNKNYPWLTMTTIQWFDLFEFEIEKAYQTLHIPTNHKRIFFRSIHRWDSNNKELQDHLHAIAQQGPITSLPKTLISELLSRELLIRSRNFNVQQLALGIKGRPELFKGSYHRDSFSLEELFTIMHQSLLNLIGNIAVNQSIDKFPKPVIVQQAKELIEKIKIKNAESGCFAKESIPKLAAISLNSDNTIQMKYNIALRCHSGSIVLTHIKNKGLTIEFSLYGHNENERWTKAKKIAERARDIFNLECTATITDCGMNIVWKVSEHQAPLLENLINTIAQAANVSQRPNSGITTNRKNAHHNDEQERIVIENAGSNVMPEYRE